MVNKLYTHKHLTSLYAKWYRLYMAIGIEIPLIQKDQVVENYRNTNMLT